MESRNYLYETSAHFASLLALLIYLFTHKHFSNSNIKAYWRVLVIATIPAIIVGLILKFYNLNFISLKLIGYSSIIGAIMLYVSDKSRIFKFNIKDKNIKFILAGLFQCLAFLPVLVELEVASLLLEYLVKIVNILLSIVYIWVYP